MNTNERDDLTCCGYPNWATFNVVVSIDNDWQTYELLQAALKDKKAPLRAHWVKSFITDIEDFLEFGLEFGKERGELRRDVDWRHLAEHWSEEIAQH